MRESGTEIQLELRSQRLAAIEWANGAFPVLAVHGWLDNAATFSRLAPRLDGTRFAALDLPGHGLSDHRPAGAPYHFIDWVADIVEAADLLGLDSFCLIGHSMGAGIATLVAATFPERIQRLVLIEGVGPLAADEKSEPQRLARAIADETRIYKQGSRVFPDLDKAIAARMSGSDLDHASAQVLTSRGIQNTEDGVKFRHDALLHAGSRFRMTETQIRVFLAAIQCPVLAIRARNGWPFPADILLERCAMVRHLQLVEVEGGHHVHLTQPDRIAPLLQEFLFA